MKSSKFTFVGQSAFFDVNGDDRVEHFVPLCTERSCVIVALDATINSTTADVDSQQWLSIADKFDRTVNSTTFNLLFTEVQFGPQSQLTLPVALRHGDLNGDGYPDIVAVMRAATTKSQNLVILLENVPGDNFLGRTFRPFAKQSQMAQPVIVAMFGKSNTYIVYCMNIRHVDQISITLAIF